MTTDVSKVLFFYLLAILCFLSMAIFFIDVVAPPCVADLCLNSSEECEDRELLESTRLFAPCWDRFVQDLRTMPSSGSLELRFNTSLFSTLSDIIVPFETWAILDYKLQCISQIKRSSSAHLPISRLRWIACVAFKMRFNIEYLMIWKMWNSCCISVNSKTEISKQFTVYHWSTLQQAITKASKQMPFPWWTDQKCFVNWTAFIVTDQPGYAAHCI